MFDELPAKLYRLSSMAGVVHLEEDCDHIVNSNGNGRWIDTEYLRRADKYRICRGCGDGTELGPGKVRGSEGGDA